MAASLGSSGLGMGIVFTLKDQFTGVAKKIQAEQARLRGSTEGLANGVSKSMSKITSAKLLAGGVAILAPLGAMVSMAAELSDQLANVQKTTGLTDRELGKLRDTVEGFNTRTSIEDLLEIGTVGGRLGVAKDELNGFIETVDRAVVALGDDFSGGAEQIATELGKIKTLFGDTKNLKFDVALNQIGSALNELGNSGANSAPSVANFTRRLGQLGKLAPTLSQTLGLGATLEELGMRADIAAGGVTNILTVAGQNQQAFANQMGTSVEAFRELINESPNQMLIELSKSFSNMDNASTIKALKDMKLGSQESIKVILGLSGATDLLVSRQALAAKAMKEGLSLQTEFDIKNRTLQAEIDKLTKKFVILGQRIGTAVAPMFMGLAAIVDGLVTLFTALIKSPVGSFILQVTTFVAMGAVAWGAYSLILKPVAMGLKSVAMNALKVMASMMPLVAVVSVVLGLVFAIRQGVRAFEDFNGEASSLSGSGLLLAQIGGIAKGIMEIVTSWDNVSETFLLSKGLASKLKSLGILDFVVNLGTWVVRIIELVKGAISTITWVFTTLFNAAKSILGVFTPIGKFLIYLAGLLGANTDQVKHWANAGKILGVIISSSLIYFIALFTSMGVAALINIGVVLINLALMAEAIIVTAALWIGQFIRMGVTALMAVLPSLVTIIGSLASIVVGLLVTAGIWITQFIIMGVTAFIAILPPLLAIIITLGSIVVGVLIMAAIWIAQFIIMGITAIIAMLPIILVVALIGLAIWAVIKIAQWLIDKFHELWGESEGWLDFGKNMVMNIWNGVKSIWGSFTGWLSSAMKSIPGVGQFFEDQEATSTVNQQINPATDNPIGDSMATQQGLLSSPISQAQNTTDSGQGETRNINLNLDGRTIAQIVEDKNSIEQARE
jgi:TP901 family phage tail tape measure protein